MTDFTDKVRVDSDAGGYDVLIGSGLLDRAGFLIREVGIWRRAFVVTDSSVAGLYLDRLVASLEACGMGHHGFAVEPGEASKSFSVLERVLEDFIEKGAERDDLVIALGGGVVGDLAGLVAGLLKRGVDVVQIPTSLLAQVDSSIGGKTAINSSHGKNLIGVFHQPRLVLADTDILASLPGRQICAGLAEIIKCALICDRAFFFRLVDAVYRLRAGQAAELVGAIGGACRIKADLVSRDERERGSRALLNLGHTFGHALEAVNGYGSSLLHGEAVGCGLALAYGYSARLGFCSVSDADAVSDLLRRVGLEPDIGSLGGGPYPVDALIAAMRQDKKVSHGALKLVLARGIGDAFIYVPADPVSVRDFLIEHMEQ